MTSLEKARIAVKALDQKKAQDIRVIRVKDLTILADYFVIAGGTSSTQVKALSDEVEYQLEQAGVPVIRNEGYQSASWIILDYGDLLVHTFQKDTRSFYALEKLWSDGENVDISDLLTD
jgi:ribosome-associated protein